MGMLHWPMTDGLVRSRNIHVLRAAVAQHVHVPCEPRACGAVHQGASRLYFCVCLLLSSLQCLGPLVEIYGENFTTLLKVCTTVPPQICRKLFMRGRCGSMTCLQRPSTDARSCCCAARPTSPLSTATRTRFAASARQGGVLYRWCDEEPYPLVAVVE